MSSIPNMIAQKQQQAPDPVKLMATVIVTLLREKAEQTELKRHFEVLISERHVNFHVKRNLLQDKDANDFRKCSNPNCRYAKELLERENRPECMLNQFSIQIAMGKSVKMKSANGSILVYVEDRNAVESPIILDENGDEPKNPLVIER
jgi:hypothetical protein